MAKFDHFNLIGPIYDRIFGGKTHSKLFELVAIEPWHTLLDLGGGTGRLTIHFKRASHSAIVADSAMKMLKVAHKKGLLTINANSETLPFKDVCFDRVIMVDAFHHVTDHQQTLNEIWRTITPGGRLIIEESDIQHGLVKLIALGEKLLFMRSKFFKPQAIISMCTFEDAEQTSLYFENGIAWVMLDKRP